MKIAFFHGWCGEPSMWSLLIPQLAGFACQADDRGYFGPPAAVDEADVVVTHSFGTMRALAAPPRGTRAIVAINGFDCFAARPDFPQGVADRVLARMEKRLAENPLAMVTEFRQRCGGLPPQAPPVPDALAADLATLRRADARDAWQGPLLVIHGANDEILPPPLQAATFARRPDAPRLTLPGHGHLAPLTAARNCAAAIRELIAGLG